jgi:hypothetical protein
MNRKRALAMLIVMALAFLFLSGCAQSTSSAATTVALNPTTTSIPPAHTPTVVPPTDTPVPPSSTPSPTDTAAPTSTSTATAIPPTNTPTPVTPTATSVPPTPTRVPATAKPKPTAVPNIYAVTWKTGIQYDARTGSSFWCKLHDEYQNNSSEDMPFQNKESITNYFFLGRKVIVVDGYEPVFGIAGPDGSIIRWGLGGWYAKRLGWPNGYEEFPPGPIKAGAPSGDWTFYSDVTTGEYCRYAYVKWKGQISAAEFSGKGDLVSTKATLPPGAP